MICERTSKFHMETPKWKSALPFPRSHRLYLIIHQIPQNLFFSSVLTTATSIIQIFWVLVILHEKLQKHGSITLWFGRDFIYYLFQPRHVIMRKPKPRGFLMSYSRRWRAGLGLEPMFSNKRDVRSLSLHPTSDYSTWIGITMMSHHGYSSWNLRS